MSRVALLVLGESATRVSHYRLQPRTACDEKDYPSHPIGRLRFRETSAPYFLIRPRVVAPLSLAVRRHYGRHGDGVEAYSRSLNLPRWP